MDLLIPLMPLFATVHEELAALRRELTEAQERLDFAERSYAASNRRWWGATFVPRAGAPLWAGGFDI